MTGYAALCTDFYVNCKLGVHMDLPSEREAILGLFERVRKARPSMSQLKRYEGELALESPQGGDGIEWMALRRTSVRSGSVNPDSIENAYKVHRTILEVVPYFLSISPLDVSSVEMLFGFDFEVEANRNDLVFEALLSDSPFAGLVNRETEDVTDCEPSIAFTLEGDPQLQARIEVKARVRAMEVTSGRYEPDPITVTCAVKKLGAVDSIDDLPAMASDLGARAETLVNDRVLPQLILPLREMISSRPD